MTARIYRLPDDGAWLINRRIATRFGHGTIIAYTRRQLHDGGWMVTVRLDHKVAFTPTYTADLVDVRLPRAMVEQRGVADETRRNDGLPT